MSACAGCGGLGSIPLHMRRCPGGDDCSCLTSVDVSCPECDGGDAAEVARQAETCDNTAGAEARREGV